MHTNVIIIADIFKMSSLKSSFSVSSYMVISTVY